MSKESNRLIKERSRKETLKSVDKDYRNSVFAKHFFMSRSCHVTEAVPKLISLGWPLGSHYLIFAEEKPDTPIFVLSRHGHGDGMSSSGAAPTPGNAGAGAGPISKAAVASLCHFPSSTFVSFSDAMTLHLPQSAQSTWCCIHLAWAPSPCRFSRWWFSYSSDPRAQGSSRLFSHWVSVYSKSTTNSRHPLLWFLCPVFPHGQREWSTL